VPGKYPISASINNQSCVLFVVLKLVTIGERSDERCQFRYAETVAAWFSLGTHASLSRPGLADLMVRGKISLARGIHCCPEFFLFLWSNQRLYIVKNMRIHTHTRLRRLYMNYRWYQITLRTQTWSGLKFRLDIYHWGAGLAVNGRIRDIGQHVLRSFFRKECSRGPQLLHLLPYRIPRRDLY
jgi:hypothetical protein